MRHKRKELSLPYVPPFSYWIIHEVSTRNPLLKNGSDKEERENEKRTKRNGRKRSGFVIFVTVYLPQFKEIVGLQ